MQPQFVAGSPLWESLWALGVIIVAGLAGWLVTRLLGYARRRLERSRLHKLLPRLLASLSRPVFLLITAEGTILALSAPSYLQPWHDALIKAAVAAAIAGAVYGLARVSGTLLEWYIASGRRRRQRIDVGLARLVRRMVLLVIYLIGGLMVLDYLGVNITAAVAGLGIGGLAVALALQPTLGNFFAGTQLVSDRVVKVGDYIELDNGTRGYVTDVGWRSTRIRTPYNNMVIIPNSRLADSIITNYYGPTMEVGVIVNCGVSYSSDLTRVQEVALEVARQVIAELDEAAKPSEPWFGYEEFGDSNINFWLWLQATDRLASFRLKSELIRRLHARFEAEGITINYPVRRLVYDSPPPPPVLPEERG